MSTIKNEEIKQPVEIDEFVDSEGGIISGDRNATDDSEIETGPVQKPYNDDSDYEKGVSTTTDRATRYRQNIPWFAVYSYGGHNSRNGYGVYENAKKKVVMTKKQIEEKIEADLVKRSKIDREVWDKTYDGKVEKVVDIIDDANLTDGQLELIKKAVLDKIKNKHVELETSKQNISGS